MKKHKGIQYVSLFLALITVISLLSVGFSTESRAESQNKVDLAGEEIPYSDDTIIAEGELTHRDESALEDTSVKSTYSVRFTSDDRVLGRVDVAAGDTLSAEDIPAVELEDGNAVTWQYIKDGQEWLLDTDELCSIIITDHCTFNMIAATGEDTGQDPTIIVDGEPKEAMPFAGDGEKGPVYVYYLREEPVNRFAPTQTELDAGTKEELGDSWKIPGKEIFESYEGEIANWHVY